MLIWEISWIICLYSILIFQSAPVTFICHRSQTAAVVSAGYCVLHGAHKDPTSTSTLSSSVNSRLRDLRWSICIGKANNLATPGGLFDYTESRIWPSGTEAHIQLPLSLGSDPGSALITGNVWVLKCRSSGELILDQRLRRWLCNEPQWEASGEEFP